MDSKVLRLKSSEGGDNYLDTVVNLIRFSVFIVDTNMTIIWESCSPEFAQGWRHPVQIGRPVAIGKPDGIRKTEKISAQRNELQPVECARNSHQSSIPSIRQVL